MKKGTVFAAGVGVGAVVTAAAGMVLTGAVSFARPKVSFDESPDWDGFDDGIILHSVDPEDTEDENGNENSGNTEE